MAELDTLQRSYGRQIHTIEQIGRGETQPNSMRVATVDCPKLLPSHGAVICRSTEGFKPTSTDATIRDHLAGAER
jgi:hypothetical protein